MSRFEGVISSREMLREIIREPSPIVTRKTLTALDEHCDAFIQYSPFVLLASWDLDGNFDVSPKDDPAGFVKILDSQTLVIPERPGNHRADTCENLLPLLEMHDSLQSMEQ